MSENKEELPKSVQGSEVRPQDGGMESKATLPQAQQLGNAAIGVNDGKVAERTEAVGIAGKNTVGITEEKTMEISSEKAIGITGERVPPQDVINPKDIGSSGFSGKTEKKSGAPGLMKDERNVPVASMGSCHFKNGPPPPKPAKAKAAAPPPPSEPEEAE